MISLFAETLGRYSTNIQQQSGDGSSKSNVADLDGRHFTFSIFMDVIA